MLEASGHLKAGKLRALAVTGDKRVSALPDVPTLSESVLPGFNAISWLGLLAPAGTRPEVVEKIAADARAVPADEAIKARFAALGGVSRGTSPKEFAKLIADDKARCAQIIGNRKITLESTRRAGRQEHDGLCLATEVSKLAPADFLLSGVADLSLISVFRQPGFNGCRLCERYRLDLQALRIARHHRVQRGDLPGLGLLGACQVQRIPRPQCAVGVQRHHRRSMKVGRVNWQ